MYVSASRFIDPLLSKMRPKLTSSIQAQLNPTGASFLPPQMSFADLQEKLRDREVAYVLLPPFLGQADIEVLVADDDLDRVAGLVTKWPGGLSIKIYSVSGGRSGHRFEPPGLRPTSHYAVALFPPHLADALIARAGQDVAARGVLRPADAFFACAYRAAYLERQCWDCSASDWVASDECERQLRAMADAADVGLERPITPRKLHDILNENEWRPSLDLLERAAHWMPWIGDILPDDEKDEAPGVSLFFIRARAVENGWRSRIVECFRENGFEPLLVVDLDESQAREAAVEFRGGNWGQGPYRVSGGPPAAICVALDLLPIAADDRLRAQFPSSDNRRTVDAKCAARDLVNRGVDQEFHYNPVHSMDNSAQAWRAVRLLIPGREAELRRKAELLRRDFASEGAIRDLTEYGRRAKVELIEFEGSLAIRKTYRPSALRFMEREIEVMERLAPIRREIPRLLDRGSNHIVMEYVGQGAMLARKHRRGGPPTPLPLAQVRELAELIAAIVAHGFDPIDLRADGNVIYSPSGLRLIDFEFWRRCAPVTPEKSMCLSGIPAGDTGDRPLAGRRNVDPYAIGWYPYTLLSVESFLYDSAGVQRVKRAANFAQEYVRWVSRGSYSRAKRFLKRVVHEALTGAVRLIGRRRAAPR